MKKSLIVLLLPMLLATLSFAQNAKPAHSKKLPTQIKLQGHTSTTLQRSVLKEQLQMTANDELRSMRTSTDELGMQHEKFQQYYQGIKVEGGTYTVHSKNGTISLMTGDYLNVTDLNVQPTLNAAAAFKAALQHVDAKQYAWEDAVKAGFPEYQKPAGELVVVADAQSRFPARLAYKFDIYAAEPLYRAYVFIDAHTGAFIQEHLRIHDSDTPATGTALYNGNVNFTADFTGTNYRLRQAASGGGVQTYNLNNGTNYNNAVDFTSSTSNFTSDPTGVQAHWGAEQVWDYYWNIHSRNSYNGTGGILKSYVHYSNNYVNAFWDGTRMTYGDGDGTNYGPLVSLDICGHEITHGVTEYSANLVYSYEPGALNESFSDIFGETIEKYGSGTNDWLMGDEIGAGGSGGAIRSFSNPNAFGDPDTYQGTYWYTGSGDNGGVHTNSGVQNKWFYILSVGETGTNDKGNSYSVSGIGMTNAAAIAYRNLTVYLSSNSNYAAARAGAIQAARDLFGVDSPEEIATTNAWYAVGVGNAYGPPPPCVTASVVLSLTLDNYPSETTWNLKNGAGTTIASGGPYSTPGATITQTFNIGTDDYTFSIFDSYGDGICCGYGSGSYSLTSGSTTIVSGGAFGSSAVTDFCVDLGGGGDTEAPTVPGNLTASNTTQTSTDLSWTASSDNVGVAGYNVYVDGVYDGNTTSLSYTVSGLSANTTYTMGVTAFDAAGNESAAATVNVTTASTGGGNTILAHYFETGWDGWQDGGSDCARYFGARSYEGNYSIQLRDNSGTASAMTSSAYNVSAYNQLTIDFYFYSFSMETGEDFWVRYYNGSGWSTVASYVSGSGGYNGDGFYHATINLSGVNFPNNAQFRFQCDASANNDLVYIDQVTVTGANTLLPGTETIATIEKIGEVIPEATQGLFAEEDVVNGLRLFPNPVRNTLQIQSESSVRSLRVFAANGIQVKDMPGFEGTYELDMSTLTPGLYFIALETANGKVHKRIVKQ